MPDKVTQEYLGDGLYAEFDGNGITLYTDRLENTGGAPERHWVYLEPKVYAALLEFVERVKQESV